VEVRPPGNLDDTWYRVRVKPEFNRGSAIGPDGIWDRVALEQKYYFKVCDEGSISDCGAVDYDVLLAIADFDRDGVFEADEVFDLSLSTCGSSETSWVAQVDIADKLDIDGNASTSEVFNQSVNGLMVGYKNNVGRSRGCVWTADFAPTTLDPDITGQICEFDVLPTAEEKLPFTLQDLVDQGVIADVSDLYCSSTVVADAGTAQVTETGELVTLDGSGSLPAGGTFAWAFTDTPFGSTATLSNADTANPTFTPDEEGNYTILLAYKVGLNIDLSTVFVDAENPVNANAGRDQGVFVGQLVTLDGSGSLPAGGTFNWVFSQRPSGSDATLSGKDTANPTFTPDEDGSYVILLRYTVGPNTGEDTVLVIAVGL
jgi:hypothetical protein